MKQFGYHLLISILALGLSILSTCLAWGFMGDGSTSFWMSLGSGFVFIMNPVCVAWLIIALFRKNAAKPTGEPKGKKNKA